MIFQFSYLFTVILWSFSYSITVKGNIYSFLEQACEGVLMNLNTIHLLKCNKKLKIFNINIKPLFDTLETDIFISCIWADLSRVSIFIIA